MNKQIYTQIAQEVANNKTSWLATVVFVAGSTPGKVGMKMIIDAEGKIKGTIGGGAIEMRVIQKVLRERPTRPVHWEFDLGGDYPNEKTGMICGGKQALLIDPLFTGHELYIIGAGHCGQALAELAAKCDFAVTMLDDRAEVIAQAAKDTSLKAILVKYSDITKHINFTAETYIVAMTHGHKHDETVMRQIVGKHYKYFGIIGSKQKVTTIFRSMLADKFSKKDLKKLFSPIGLHIGSQTPYEIAVSILAQLIAVKNNIKAIELNSNPLS